MDKIHKKSELDKTNETKELFLIHSMSQLYTEEGSPLPKFNLILFQVKERSLELESNNNFPTVEYYVVDMKNVEGYIEGQFVYRYQGENGNVQLFNANKDSRARQQIMINNRLRASIMSFNENHSPMNLQNEENGEIFSYHVNVGHGNCSFLVIKGDDEIKIWSIDCSERDFLTKHSYRKNIDNCLKYISEKFKLDEVKIEKFFLTHSHYDHFSGFIYLIKKYGASNAEFWFNPFYSFSSSAYNDLLKLLNDKVISKKLKTIDSYPWNNTPNIRILNEDALILRTKPSKGHKGISNLMANFMGVKKPIIQNKINDSSIVYQFKFGKKSMVFPGDIEEKGWQYINTCIPYLSETNYYCLSHHGSMNGHIRKNCPANFNIQDVTKCCEQVDVLFVQGRDGAFSGIISPKVISDLTVSGRRKPIYRTDQGPNGKKNPIFFEIDWSTDCVLYHY
ncbi:hypothetical protein [Bacillus cereus]|uniref:hypothetical protein n=2 Tax=Bacillus cereus TaxID=1396 RepID=UPI00362512DF